jgi:mRNA-degrading endonuclease toxin of MazEF toxin-antitoxin module
MSGVPTPLKIGTIVSVALPTRDPRGVEIVGLHPAIVLAIISARLDLAWIIPVTTDRGYGWIDAHPNLYPRLPGGMGGLPHDSVALLDQLQAVDLARLKRAFGVVPAPMLVSIQKGLAKVLGCTITAKSK